MFFTTKAWLLVIWVAGQPIAVPGLASKAECERVAAEIGQGSSQFTCTEYRKAGW